MERSICRWEKTDGQTCHISCHVLLNIVHDKILSFRWCRSSLSQPVPSALVSTVHVKVCVAQAPWWSWSMYMYVNPKCRGDHGLYILYCYRAGNNHWLIWPRKHDAFGDFVRFWGLTVLLWNFYAGLENVLWGGGWVWAYYARRNYYILNSQKYSAGNGAGNYYLKSRKIIPQEFSAGNGEAFV